MKVSTSIYICLFALILCGSLRVTAQEIIVPENTALSLALAKDVTSKLAHRGDEVGFTVANDLTIDGQIIIKRGTYAKGSVIYAEKGGYLGHSGKLAIQVESTSTVDGQSLPLHATNGSEGDATGRVVMALTVFTGPFGALKKGGDTTLKAGTEIPVYTAEVRRFRLDGGNLVAIGGKAPAPGTPAGEVATVYIFRQKKMFGAAMEPSVFCDGVELARMDNGRYFMLELSPGTHIIHLTSEKKGYEINMGPGQTYYFRIGIEVGMWKGNGKILLEPNETGAAEVKKVKPLGADKIKDKNMVIVNNGS